MNNTKDKKLEDKSNSEVIGASELEAECLKKGEPHWDKESEVHAAKYFIRRIYNKYGDFIDTECTPIY